MDRRSQILRGELKFPEQIMTIMDADSTQQTNIQMFWDNIWVNYLREKPCDTITWFEMFTPEFFNTLILHLSRSGWISSIIENNYANIHLNDEKLMKWVSKEELRNLKFTYKFNKYRLKKTKSELADIVQINGQHRPTGLHRYGFMKAGNNIFKYDTKYLLKYLPEITENIKKGLGPTSKDISYQEINDELINWYSVDGTEYTLGNCLIDSRGRSIFQCSKKIFNPVSCKDARALLITEPQKLTIDGVKVVFAAIAELLGYRGKNIEDKIKFGEASYILRTLPDIEEMRADKDYDDLHVRIWLERIYDNLSDIDNWTVPIEMDALASVIQFIGVLTNDHEYMDRTNMINEQFKDAWTVSYCSRNHVKKAMTPRLYGSGKNPKDLWDKNKLEYSQVQLNKIAEEISVGIYANANNFKDFIINNVVPQKKMKVRVWNEEFEIECNRFKWEETVPTTYLVYDSQGNGKLRKVTRNLNRVPDVNQFKRYFVTCLVHNLDSQVADFICNNVNWVLPNHDSFTIHPNDAMEVRQIYTNKMLEIYKNRKKILKDYFNSIGIEKEYKDKNEEEITSFLPWCLK